MNKQGKKIRNNIILFAAAVILGLSFITSVDDAVFSSVALDQEARCGMEEHQHTDDCYNGSILGCGKEIHTHSSSCYMLLLEENNVNTILEKVVDSEVQDLDSLVADTIEQAVKSSGSSKNLTASQVNKLSAVEESETLVLNEKMKTRYGQVQILAAPALETDAIVLAVGDQPETSGNYLNFYIYLDGEWTFLDSMEYSVENNWWYSQAYANREDILESVNNSLGTSFTNNSFRLVYSTSESSSTGTNVDLTNQISFGNRTGPIYVRLVPDSRNSGWNTTTFSFNTVTLVYSDTSRESKIVQSGSTLTLPTGYYWSENSVQFTNQVTNPTINSAKTYYAYYRVRFSEIDGSTVTEYERPGKTIQLPYDNGETRWWSEETEPEEALQSGVYVQVNGNNTYYSFHQIKYVYPDGRTETEYIRTNDNEVTLAENYIWTDNYGNVYDGGTSVEVAKDTIFTASIDDKIIVTYNINFPSVSGVTVSTKPTVMGGSTYAQTIENGQMMTVTNVSQSKVEGKVNNNNTGLTRVIQFKGWKVNNGDTVIQPGVTLTYDTLAAYGSRISLTAIWEYDARQTVSFFVSYASEITDANGNVITNQDYFTPQIFASYLENLDTNMSVNQLNNAYRIDTADPDSTAANIKADQDIRALSKKKDDGVWLAEFPTDEYIFNELKKYADDLSVDGISVKAEDLHDNGYTIRWYVFKSQSDAWHIDGVLVRKIGKMNVSKSFAGNAKAIADAKAGGFYIKAQNEDNRSVNLTLNSSSYTSYDALTDTYTWTIEDIKYGEEWYLSEHNYASSGINPYAEYIVVDATGQQSAMGTIDLSASDTDSVTVTGMTYASDAGADEIMSVDFTNVYRGTDSIIIKKEDSQTGRPLGGAGFTLYQNNNALRFTKTAGTNVYTSSVTGNIEIIESGTGGFIEVVITGLDFTKGAIDVSEVITPEGYINMGSVRINKNASGDIIIQGTANGARLEEGVLVIGNTSQTISVTVQKNWSDMNDAQDVEVQLLANGRLVSTLVSWADAEVTLNEDNAFTHTWTSLPMYANGGEIVWTAREVKIGSEQAKDDFTFSNWVVTYGQPRKTGTSDNPAVTLDITNTRRDGTTLVVIKEGKNGVRLSDAVFSLQLMDPSDPTKPYTGMSPVEKTSNNLGLINFSNLPYGKYMLTEVSAPYGYYQMTEPIHLTINDDHTVSVESGRAYVQSASDLAIVVQNIKQDALPETGGRGTGSMHMIGAILMMIAAIILLNPFNKRKEENH